MSSIVPPPPTNPTPIPVPPTPIPVLAIGNPPPALAQLNLGAILDGQVLAQLFGQSKAPSGHGVFQIQSPLGLLSVVANVPLPPGSRISLQLLSLSPQLLFQITAINGKTPPAVTPQAGTGQVPNAGGAPVAGSVTGPTATAPGPVTLTVGSTVTATLLQPARGTIPTPATPAAANTSAVAGGQAAAASPSLPLSASRGAPQGASAGSPPPQTATGPGPGPSATPASPATLTGLGAAPAGSGAPVRNAATAQPSTAPEPAGTGGPAQARPAQAGATQGQAHSTADATLPQQAGTRINVRIVAMTPPPTGGSHPPAQAPVQGDPLPGGGQLITGTVARATHAGQPIIQTPVGTLSLDTKSPLPPGSTVTLQLSGPPTTPLSPSKGVSPFSLEGLSHSREWPNLKEAINVLHQSNPAAAQHLTSTAIPRADSQLAANILLFLGALRSGDIRGWFGNSGMRSLERVRPDLMNGLREDFTRISQLADDRGPADWRLTLIPFLNGAEIEQIRLFMRRNLDKKKKKNETPGTRFIIDVDLSRLGRIQLDGLVQSEGKQLDLIMRTEQPLLPEMRNDIRAIYVNAAEITGFKGGLTFQSSPPGFIELTPNGDIKAEGFFV